ncbi:hypothetical protein QL285_008410 [Trifolium repens]|nr:hypothetical protein QL285_008410 [Trifolium repens]
MKTQADKKRQDITMEVGDEVLLKLQPYRQHSAALRENQKLSMKYFGPFKTIAKVGSVAYKLQLPPTARIHPVFYVSQLKLFKGDTQEPYMPLPLTVTEMGPVIQPTQVLATRTVLKGTQHTPQILVQWENGLQEEATWEDLEDIKASYPNFNLEDKVDVKGEGNVMNEQSRGKGVQGMGESHGEVTAHNQLPNFEDKGRGKREKRASWKLRG